MRNKIQRLEMALLFVAAVVCGISAWTLATSQDWGTIVGAAIFPAIGLVAGLRLHLASAKVKKWSIVAFFFVYVGFLLWFSLELGSATPNQFWALVAAIALCIMTEAILVAGFADKASEKEALPAQAQHDTNPSFN